MGREKIFFVCALLLAALSGSVHAGFFDSLPVVWNIADLEQSPLSAAPACQTGEGNPFEESKGWLVPSFLAFALMIGLISFVYVLSGIGSTQRIRAWCKEALFGVLGTGVLIALMAGAYAGMSNFGVNYLDKAIGYSQIMRNTLGLDFLALTVFSMFVSFLSQAPSIAAWGLGLRFSLVPVLKPIFDMLGIILNLSIASLGEWFAQEFFLCFIKHNMLAIFLPLSLFLRAFTPTKALGNTMMAIAIGFFFIYPFLVSMNADIVSDKYGHPVIADANDTRCAFYPPQAKCVYWTGLWSSMKEAFGVLGDAGWLNTGLLAMVWLLLSKFITIFGGALVILVASMVPLFLQSIAYFVFVVSVILPVFNIFVTITITMEIAKVLGTEMDLSAIEKLL